MFSIVFVCKFVSSIFINSFQEEGKKNQVMLIRAKHCSSGKINFKNISGILIVYMFWDNKYNLTKKQKKL